MDTDILAGIQQTKNRLDRVTQTLSNKEFLLKSKKEELNTLLDSLYKTYDCSSVEELTNKLIALTTEVQTDLNELNSLIGGN